MSPNLSVLIGDKDFSAIANEAGISVIELCSYVWGSPIPGYHIESLAEAINVDIVTICDINYRNERRRKGRVLIEQAAS